VLVSLVRAGLVHSTEVRECLRECRGGVFPKKGLVHFLGVIFGFGPTPGMLFISQRST